jgi:hypothetical protein
LLRFGSLTTIKISASKRVAQIGNAIGSSASDFTNFDPRVLLPMAGTTLVVLPPVELLNVDFIAFFRTEYLGGYFGTLDGGRAELQAFVPTNRQNFGKLQSVPNVYILTQIDVQTLAWFNFVLATAVYENGVHGFISSSNGSKRAWQILADEATKIYRRVSQPSSPNLEISAG